MKICNLDQEIYGGTCVAIINAGKNGIDYQFIDDAVVEILNNDLAAHVEWVSEDVVEVYAAHPEWARNYLDSGGMWGYEFPD